MEITLELVERLREKADVGYALAKEALEYSGGNLLDALIYLEEKGAIPRAEGAYYSTKSEAPPPPPPAELNPVQPHFGEKKKKASKPPWSKGKGGCKGFFTALRRWLIDNELEIWRHDQPVTALPVLILLLLLICAFLVAISVLLLGLFLGFRYRFSGPDLEREDLNNMIGSVADTAADLGRQVMDELKHDWHSDEKDKK